MKSLASLALAAMVLFVGPGAADEPKEKKEKTPTAAEELQRFQGTWTALDPRVTQYVELFGTWSASNAANTTTVHQFKLFGLN